eukprot:GFYU01001133.1.p1 GENE.GFYU01001133.1~~GFYU01001133.1.p1  ORF type:complete len:279 (-),score=48.39 GFYU01001133.1:175-1011(-)
MTQPESQTQTPLATQVGPEVESTQPAQPSGQPTIDDYLQILKARGSCEHGHDNCGHDGTGDTTTPTQAEDDGEGTVNNTAASASASVQPELITGGSKLHKDTNVTGLEDKTTFLSLENGLPSLSVPFVWKLLQERHSERVAAYQAFEACFKQLVETKNFHAYGASCREITKVFQKCSEEVILLEGELKDTLKEPQLGNLVRKIQNQERRKFELTINLQVLRQQIAFELSEEDRESHSHPHHEKVAKARSELDDVMTAINEYYDEFRCEVLERQADEAE